MTAPAKLPFSESIRNRLRAAWNCLMGRPTMYRMDVADGMVTAEPGTIIAENHFRISGPDARYRTAIAYRTPDPRDR